MSPAELAIRDAVLAVEAVGAHVDLTGVVVDLTEARDRLADYMDKRQLADVLDARVKSSGPAIVDPGPYIGPVSLRDGRELHVVKLTPGEPCDWPDTFLLVWMTGEFRPGDYPTDVAVIRATRVSPYPNDPTDDAPDRAWSAGRNVDGPRCDVAALFDDKPAAAVAPKDMAWTEEMRLELHAELVRGGLSDAEARGRAWPEDGSAPPAEWHPDAGGHNSGHSFGFLDKASADALKAQLEHRPARPPLKDCNGEPLDAATLDPGVRRLVRFMDSHGFDPFDSGDGVSKAVEERLSNTPHVHCRLPTSAIAFSEARRAYELLIGAGVDFGSADDIEAVDARSVQLTYDPRLPQFPPFLGVYGVTDADLTRSGWLITVPDWNDAPQYLVIDREGNHFSSSPAEAILFATAAEAREQTARLRSLPEVPGGLEWSGVDVVPLVPDL